MKSYYSFPIYLYGKLSHIMKKYHIILSNLNIYMVVSL